MTRKDYIALAAAFANVETPAGDGSTAWRATRDAIEKVLEYDSPKTFDRARFIAATLISVSDR